MFFDIKAYSLIETTTKQITTTPQFYYTISEF